ncbi:hypothetical protein ADN00_18825 [Ornatilinea apprima]|uniref:PD-(D/E)XK endonuclease-like domain-containing protein n=1 Tax=Ornatilinea apprima TaxID=1134406 RepID=A0A0P6X7G0_9CHLR|nr:PD-(D/E)XK nuclease family protein [Ornatilinea apprima]KPL70099.1 hypothetical protein ADN00_18825 [Ornatilinea apprima]
MIEHLSYSSISTYLTCAASWKFHYLDKVTAPTSTALIFGSAFHNTVEGYLAGIANGGKPDLMEIWQEKWREQSTVKNEKGELITREDVDWGADTPESLCNDGIRLLSHDDIHSGILSIIPGVDSSGVKIERKVTLQVPGVPVPIIGFIDIVTADGIPGDFKTSNRSWSAEKALGETQPLFYLAALNQAGIQTPGWKFRHFVFVKTKKPQFQVLEHGHTPGQMMWLFSMIQKVWKGIDAGIFPENPTGWKCDPQYCEYWHLCRGKC